MTEEQFRDRLIASLERIADALEGEPTVAPRSGGTGRPPPPPPGRGDGG